MLAASVSQRTISTRSSSGVEESGEEARGERNVFLSQRGRSTTQTMAFGLRPRETLEMRAGLADVPSSWWCSRATK